MRPHHRRQHTGLYDLWVDRGGNVEITAGIALDKVLCGNHDLQWIYPIAQELEKQCKLFLITKGVLKMPEVPQTKEEWLSCINLPEMFAAVVAGCLRPIGQPTIWIDGNGKHLTEEQYKQLHGVDPHVVWDAVKEYRRSAGKKDKMAVL